MTAYWKEKENSLKFIFYQLQNAPTLLTSNSNSLSNEISSFTKLCAVTIIISSSLQMRKTEV